MSENEIAGSAGILARQRAVRRVLLFAPPGAQGGQGCPRSRHQCLRPFA